MGEMGEVEVNTIINIVLSIQHELKSQHGINTVLAGGAPRDLMHALVPKDFDLFYLGPYDGCIHSVGNHVYNALVKIADGSHVEYYETYNDDACDIDTVLKFEVHGIPFDLIVHNTWPSTPQEVIELFDLNLNQVYLSEDGALCAEEDNPLITDVVSLTMNPDRPSKERVDALAKRFPEYDWSGVYAGLELDYV